MPNDIADKILSHVFPDGVRGTDQLRVAARLAEALELHLTKRPGAAPPPVPDAAPSVRIPADPFLVALVEGVTVADVAKRVGTSEAAARARIGRLAERGAKFEVTDAVISGPGRPAQHFRMIKGPDAKLKGKK